MFLFVTLLIINVVLFCLALKLYSIISAKKCTCKDDMNNKTVLITGGSRGIGKEAARELARRNARVIIACRDLKVGNETASEIASDTGNSNVVVKYCNLSSFKSIRSFAEEVNKTENRLDVLICNAAVVPPPGKYLTEDGLEVQFGTDHLGHFLLTSLLLDLLKKSKPSRIVVVSSSLYYFGDIKFDNLNFEKSIVDPFFVYCNAKLANILFVKSLAKKLEKFEITANALHPGLVRTEINKQTPWYIRNFIQPIAYFWAKNTVQGAQTVIHLAVSKKVGNVSGKYFTECRESWSSSKSNDMQLAEQLWQVSEKMVGIETFD